MIPSQFLDNWLKDHKVDPQSNLPAQAEIFSQSVLTQKRFNALGVGSAMTEVSEPVTKGMRTILVVSNLAASDTVFVVLDAPNGATDATSGIPLDAGEKVVMQLPFTHQGRISVGCAAGETATVTVLEGRLNS